MALQKIWKPSSLSRDRQLDIFRSLIESKLLCSLSCLCLSAAERRRLNGFQNRCLRQILRIPPAFISRVSNAEVLRPPHYRAATDLLLPRQLLLFGKFLRCPRDHVMHQTALIPGTMQPATDRFIRRVGRPRREWISETRKQAFEVLDGHREEARLVHDHVVWRRSVCRSLLVHAPPSV